MTAEELRWERYRFAELESTWLVIDTTGHERLNGQISGSTGMREVLKAIAQRKEIWAYMSEAEALQGKDELAATNKITGSSAVILPFALTLILNQTEAMGEGGVLHVSGGLPNAFDLTAMDVKGVKRLALCLRLAEYPSIHVLQDGEGFAMSRETGGKKYALGFLTKDEGIPILEKTKASSPNCQLEANKPKQLVQELIDSPFEGITLNYKCPTETTLLKEDLLQLREVLAARRGTTFGVLKKMLGRS